MQNLILKAGETDSVSQFYIALASIDVMEDGRYKAILTLGDRKKPRSKYAASDIHIIGRSKATVYKQVQEVAAVFPPMKTIKVMDMEEIRKLYEN